MCICIKRNSIVQTNALSRIITARGKRQEAKRMGCGLLIAI